jgi:creatinine amidohydrolase
MQWEQLTAPEFVKAVRKTGVCILAMGVIEKHSNHLPVGTDYLVIHREACLAARKEPAVVFPPWYLGQNYNCMSLPGAVAVEPDLLIRLIEGIFDEIRRNGFRKIILFNGHGGNDSLIRWLARCTMWKEKPYSLYVASDTLDAERREEWESICETTEHGHACECETSISLAVHPELVKMKMVPRQPATALRRLKHLGGAITGVNWYSNYPDLYAGDARPATVEKGRRLLELEVDSFAEFIAAVKADKVVPALQKEFFEKAKRPAGK